MFHPFWKTILQSSKDVDVEVEVDRHNSWEQDPDSNDDKHLKITGNKRK